MPSKTRAVATLAAVSTAAVGLTVVPAQAATSYVVHDDELSVCERDTRETPIAFTIEKGDRITLTADGDIWSGVWFQSRTKPAGRWNEYGDNRDYPLPGARKFSLVAHMDGSYRYAGEEFYREATYGSQRVTLTINDDVPGNGNGCFWVKVRVTRPA